MENSSDSHHHSHEDEKPPVLHLHAHAEPQKPSVWKAIKAGLGNGIAWFGGFTAIEHSAKYMDKIPGIEKVNTFLENNLPSFSDKSILSPNSKFGKVLDKIFNPLTMSLLNGGAKAAQTYMHDKEKYNFDLEAQSAIKQLNQAAKSSAELHEPAGEHVHKEAQRRVDKESQMQSMAIN